MILFGRRIIMKKGIIFSVPALLLVIFISGINAQYSDTLWTKIYGGTAMETGEWIEPVHSNAVNGDLGFIATGITLPWDINRFDLSILRFDSNGDTLWTRIYGGPYHDGGSCIKEVSDGFLICGNTQLSEFGIGRMWLLKIDSNGDTLWTQTHGGAYSTRGNCLALTSDSGYVVAGISSEEDGYYYDMYLARFDRDNSIQWSRVFGAEGVSEHANSVVQTPDGGYIIAGSTSILGYGPQMYLVKLDEYGYVEWTRDFGDTGYDGGYSVVLAPDNGYVVAGYKTINEGVDHHDFYIVKTDINGYAEWERTFGRPGHDVAFSIRRTYDDCYIVCGSTNDIALGWQDSYALLLNGYGDMLWDIRVERDEVQSSMSVCQAPEGDFVMLGDNFSYVNDNTRDYYLVRFFGVATNVSMNQSVLPSSISLYQNYPNPFNATTVISYSLDHACRINIGIYDVLGRKAQTLADENQVAGYHSIVFDASSLTSGIYFYKLVADNYSETRQMILVK
jgi:hypothetical protein